MTDPVLRIILDVLNKTNVGLEVNWSDIKPVLLIQYASRNRVAYAFTCGVLTQKSKSLLPGQRQIFSRVKEEAERWIISLRKTLIFVDEVLSTATIPHMIVKTFKCLPYVTYDVDVLVHPGDYSAVGRAFDKAGAIRERHPGKQSLHQVNYRKDGLLKIDLHREFSWQGGHYMDSDLLWHNSREKEIAGVNCNAPSLEVEVLLNIEHILYERRYLTLLDFLFLKFASLDGLDETLLFEQAARYQWKRALFNFTLLVNRINSLLYGEEAGDIFKNDNGSPDANSDLSLLTLPYIFPVSFVLSLFQEKMRAGFSLPKSDLAYYFYAHWRYYLSGRKRLPFYLDYLDYKQLQL